ncbi:MAG: hypothetical protein EH224_15150 [Calditrichaeota bacterium]|nr:MAG: hypothetical protein EH224_15150 [Calditrichota bacterium]
MSIEKYYIDCTHRVKTGKNQSTSGRSIKTYTDVPIRGYKGTQIDKPVVVAGKNTIDTKYKFFSSTFNFKNGDLIVYEGETYEIAGMPKNTANKNHHCKIYIRKIEGVT